MNCRLFLSAVGLFLAVSFLLIVHGESAAVIDCGHALSHDEQIEYAELQFKSATAELDKVYEQLDSVLNAEQRKALTDSHQTWLACRKAHCYSITLPLVPGSIVGVVAASRGTDLTNERVKTLRESSRYLLSKKRKEIK